MTDLEFDKIVADVWIRIRTMLPEDLRTQWDKIDLVVENEPPAEILAEIKGTELEHEPDLICGLLLGTPLMESPARVYLFRMALLDLTDYDGSPEAVVDLKEEIAITVLHEVGDFFGLDEDALDRLDFA